ncbi:MAG: hypothetical protein ABJE95_31790 [Byssovorax sp.]
MSKSTTITLEIGNLRFHCKGDAKWTAKQFDRLLDHLARNGPEETTVRAAPAAPEIVVITADVAEYGCDVLVLKYAQGFHGADHAVARRLAQPTAETGFDRDGFSLQPWTHQAVSSRGTVSARSVLFVGVPSLGSFGYDQIQEFAAHALRAVVESTAPVDSIAMTIHGVGYGLQEQEAFQAQLAGIRIAFGTPDVKNRIRRVAIVERDPERAHRLREQLRRDNGLG